MKEFNLSHALNGLPVVTRDGYKAMHVCTVNNELNGTFYFWKIFEDNNECLVKTDLTGKAMPGNMLEMQHLSYHDLFMAPVKRQEWANVYQDEGKYTLAHSTYPSYAEAYEGKYGDKYVNTVLIREWED